VKAVLYTRVSSKEQEKEGYSIPAQQKLLREYSRKLGLTIAQEFTDVETAKSAGRTRFGKMFEYLKANPSVRVILVEKTDRLYRNFRDYVLLEDLGVEIHLVRENEIISKDSRSHAKFIHGIKVLMAKNFIDNLSEEVKKGLLEKAERGQWPHQAPLGYVNNVTTRLVEPDSEKVPHVRRLFEMYSTGEYSISRVRDRLYAEGLRSRTGKRLSKSMTEMILKNPFYHGEFIWSGVRYNGVHEPLINRELFDRVQQVLKADGKPRFRKRDFAFKGLLKCARCGCAIVAEIKKGKYIYYHCTQGRGECDQPYVREEVLEAELGEVLKTIQVDQDVADWIVNALESSQKDEREYRESQVKRLQRRHNDLQARLDKAYEDRLDGIIDDGFWRDVSSRWRTEQSTIVEQIERYKRADGNYVDQGVRIIELAQQAYPLYLRQNASEKRRLLNFVLSNCTLDGLTLYPTYKKPFDLIVEGVKMQTWYPVLNDSRTIRFGFARS